MSTFEFQESHGERADDSDTGARARGRLDTALLWFVIVLLAISPVPLGSTPPLTWPIWGAAIALAGIVYLAFLARSRWQLRLGLATMALPTAGFLLVCCYLVIQIIPFGDIVGGFWINASDATPVRLRTLSVAPGDTLLMLLRMLSFGLLFFLAAQVAASRRRRNILLRAIAVIVLAHALYALLALFQFGDTFLGVPKWKYFGVATGTFLNRNSFATYLAMGLAVTTALLASALIRRRPGHGLNGIDGNAVLYAVAAVIMMATILLTNSRMGLLVGGIAIGATMLFAIARNTAIARPVLYALPIVLILLAALFLAYGELLWFRLEETGDNFEFRLELYRQVMLLIAERPWLGFGGGTFEQAFPIVHQANLSPQLSWDKAHNTYLALWSELGIVVGSIPIILVALLAARMLLDLVKRGSGWTARAVTLVVILVVGVHSLLDFSLEIEAVAFLFVVICAVGFAANRDGAAQA